MKVYCFDCGKNYRVPKGYRGNCPICGGTVVNVWWMNLIALIICLIAVGGFYSFKYLPDLIKPAAYEVGRNESMARTIAQDFVKRKIKNPDAAKFIWTYRDDVRYVGNGKWEFYGAVDAPNSFGGIVRTKFKGVLMEHSSGKWEELILLFN